MQKRTRVVLGIGAGILVVAVCAVVGWKWIASNPDVRLLIAHGGVDWIRFPGETSLRVQPLGEFQTTFRKQWTIEELPREEAVLAVRALADAAVYVNDRLVLEPHRAPRSWKTAREVDLAPFLRAGENELRIEAFTTNGPRSIWARCTVLGLATDSSWEVSDGDGNWVRAVTAHDVEPSALSRSFATPRDAFVRTLPLTALVFVGALAAQWAIARKRKSSSATPDAAAIAGERVPPGLRFVVMGAVLVLGVNNLFRIPMVTGFDIEGHINYIHYIATKGALPLAHEGWQMFQSPLYYLVCAGPYWALSKVFDLDVVVKLLRIVPVLCSVAQVELAYRIVRRVYPDRQGLQMAGAVFAGVLPMNLYISQYIGNEPMAGVLSGLVCLQCVTILSKCADQRGLMRSALALGGLLALAILTKVTAVLLVLPCIVVLLYAAWRVDVDRVKRAAIAFGCFAGMCALLCGWYFARNWMHYGKPFVGGWEVAREIVWWQDPGYRTVGQMVLFGESLVRPITAGTAGMLDAFYSTFWLDGLLSSMVEFEHRPPWNYAFVIAGAWWAIVPASLIGFGILWSVRSLRTAEQRLHVFEVVCVAIYFGAFAYLFLALPTYSTGKATYTLGVLPLYVLLFVAGLDVVSRNTSLRMTSYACIAAWACAAYAAYFVV